MRFELVIIAGSLWACSSNSPSPSSNNTSPTTTSNIVASPPKPKTMPELLVDAEGPYLGGQRPHLEEAGGQEKLLSIVQSLPIEGKPVTLIADKRANPRHVSQTIDALGKAGAPKIIVKTEGRKDLPSEIALTPVARISDPPGCSVVNMVQKDYSTAVWAIRGGVAKKFRKGFAGPDFSNTIEQLKKDVASCNSTMTFTGADDGVTWDMVHNLVGAIMTADEKKKLDTFVLMHHTPIAGRAIELVSE